MHALTKLLRAAGFLGIAITGAIITWFVVRTDYYFPDRYEDALAAGFYVIAVWAGYGFVCAIFFGLQTFLVWRSKRQTKLPNKSCEATGDNVSS